MSSSTYRAVSQLSMHVSHLARPRARLESTFKPRFQRYVLPASLTAQARSFVSPPVALL